MILSERLTSDISKCYLCPHQCELEKGETGKCLARKNIDGDIKLDAYGSITNMAVEPIEKKPLYHFYPSTKVLSVGGFGCSAFCDYCQNFMVSQRDRSKDSKKIMPDEVVKIALSKGASGICMTYNEPTIYYEYLVDLCTEAKKNGLYFIIKTNGIVNEDVWEDVLYRVDAINLDFKGSKKDYRDIVKVDEDCYNNFINNFHKALDMDMDRKVHLEISVPIYPHVSHKDQWIIDFRKVLETYNPFVPVHLLKVFPANETVSWISTPNKLLFNIKDYLSEKLDFVYIANIFDEEAKKSRYTYDPDTNEVIIKRENLKTMVLKDNEFIINEK